MLPENRGPRSGEGFTVDEVLVEDGRVQGIRGRSQGGAAVTERARVVVGADGRNSRVAAAIDVPRYNEKPPLQAGYYTYFSGLPTEGRFEVFSRPDRAFGAMETHDGLTMVVAGWPYAEFEASKKDIEGSFMRAIDTAPDFAKRIRAGKREARFAGGATPNFFRKPYGAGWALVGDAGYIKDPVTAQGISDAFLDAERCATALEASFSGAQTFDDAMDQYQRARDTRAMPIYELTLEFASMAPPPPHMQALLGAVSGNQSAMDDFARVIAGGLSPIVFFAPENVERILSAARMAS